MLERLAMHHNIPSHEQQVIDAWHRGLSRRQIVRLDIVGDTTTRKHVNRHIRENPQCPECAAR